MISSTLCPAVHILGFQNLYSRAEGIADHHWPWAVFLEASSPCPSVGNAFVKFGLLRILDDGGGKKRDEEGRATRRKEGQGGRSKEEEEAKRRK